jgi:hypothetical protein
VRAPGGRGQAQEMVGEEMVDERLVVEAEGQAPGVGRGADPLEHLGEGLLVAADPRSTWASSCWSQQSPGAPG